MQGVARGCRTTVTVRAIAARRPLTSSSTLRYPRERYGRDRQPWYASDRDLTIHPRPDLSDRQINDIIQGDLSATLAAHKASNREATYRVVKTGPRSKPAVDYEAQQDQDDQDEQEKIAAVKDFVDTLAADAEITAEERLGLDGISDMFMDAESSARSSAKDNYESQSTTQAPLPIAQASGTRKKSKERTNSAYVPPKQPVSATGSYRPWTLLDYDAELPEQDESVRRRERLNQDIGAICDFLTLSDAEYNYRNLLVKQAIIKVKEHMPQAELEVFGSQESKLATFTSDIDIAFRLAQDPLDVSEPNSASFTSPKYRKKVQTALYKLARYFRSEDKFRKITVIDKAHYPLVRAVHKVSGVEFEIVSTRPQHNAWELISKYLEEFPHARSVFMVLKTALAARDLDDAQSGGVGSYPLILMIVAAFKHVQGPIRPQSPLHSLLQVLAFYAELDTRKSCLSVEPPELFPKLTSSIVGSQKRKEELRNNPSLYWRHRLSVAIPEQQHLLCLQDPADSTNDVGRKAFRILQVQAVFSRLHDSLTDYLNGSTSSDQHPFDEFFGGHLGHIYSRRAAFQEWCENVQLHLESREGLHKQSAIPKEVLPKTDGPLSLGARSRDTSGHKTFDDTFYPELAFDIEDPASRFRSPMSSSSRSRSQLGNASPDQGVEFPKFTKRPS